MSFYKSRDAFFKAKAKEENKKAPEAAKQQEPKQTKPKKLNKV